MRTTLDIAPDVLDHARKVAEASGISMGRVISDLARRGVDAPAPFKMQNGIAVFDFPDTGHRFSSEDVQKALDEDDLKYAAFFPHSSAKKRQD